MKYVTLFLGAIFIWSLVLHRCFLGASLHFCIYSRPSDSSYTSKHFLNRFIGNVSTDSFSILHTPNRTFPLSLKEFVTLSWNQTISQNRKVNIQTCHRMNNHWNTKMCQSRTHSVFQQYNSLQPVHAALPGHVLPSSGQKSHKPPEKFCLKDENIPNTPNTGQAFPV